MRPDAPSASALPNDAYAFSQHVDAPERSRRVEAGAGREEPAPPRPARSCVPGVSFDAADRYIEQHRSERPWLQMVDGSPPQVRRIIAAADIAGGHGHIRHEGWVTDNGLRRRAAYLEDPAQLDPGKRQRGIDGLKQGASPKHACADLATRITSPEAYATAFALGSMDREVRDALNSRYDTSSCPDPVEIPISALLGKDGHKLCAGWMLTPMEEGGSMDDARQNRKEWRKAMAENRTPVTPEPAVQRVPTFEGGSVIFALGHNKNHDGYEIVSMYAQPRDDVLPPR